MPKLQQALKLIVAFLQFGISRTLIFPGVLLPHRYASAAPLMPWGDQKALSLCADPLSPLKNKWAYLKPIGLSSISRTSKQRRWNISTPKGGIEPYQNRTKTSSPLSNTLTPEKTLEQGLLILQLAHLSLNTFGPDLRLARSNAVVVAQTLANLLGCGRVCFDDTSWKMNHNSGLSDSENTLLCALLILQKSGMNTPYNRFLLLNPQNGKDSLPSAVQLLGNTSSILLNDYYEILASRSCYHHQIAEGLILWHSCNEDMPKQICQLIINAGPHALPMAEGLNNLTHCPYTQPWLEQTTPWLIEAGYYADSMAEALIVLYSTKKSQSSNLFCQETFDELLLARDDAATLAKGLVELSRIDVSLELLKKHRTFFSEHAHIADLLGQALMKMSQTGYLYEALIKLLFKNAKEHSYESFKSYIHNFQILCHLETPQKGSNTLIKQFLDGDENTHSLACSLASLKQKGHLTPHARASIYYLMLDIQKAGGQWDDVMKHSSQILSELVSNSIPRASDSLSESQMNQHIRVFLSHQNMTERFPKNSSCLLFSGKNYSEHEKRREYQKKYGF